MRPDSINAMRGYLRPEADEPGLFGEDPNRKNEDQDAAFCAAMERAIANGVELRREPALTDTALPER